MHQHREYQRTSTGPKLKATIDGFQMVIMKKGVPRRALLLHLSLAHHHFVGLYIKAEVHDVAVLHLVFLALDVQQAGLAHSAF